MIADPLENGKVPFDRDHNIPANDLDRLTGANQPLQWADLDCDEQLDLILNNPMRSAWLLPEAIETLTFFRKIPQQWAYIKARYAEIYGSTKDLEKAVDTQLEVDLAKAKKSAQKDSEGLSSHLVRTDCELGTPHEIKGKRFSSLNSLSSQGDNWPVLQPEALYGLAGDIVKKLTPHTEADPVAILTQFLTYSGVVIGRKKFYQVEATRHYINMFLAIVGNTAKGRKGTSFGHVDEGMRAIDGTWTEDNLASACGSGEGLIAAVRDATYVTQPIKEKGRVVDYQQVMTDPGVEDKRLLVAEQEFSSVLKIASREGNILSDTMRRAWETGNLKNQVKANPLKATGAHVGIIGHITRTELERLLTATDAANGFANRFLWVCVKRHQLLPDGGTYRLVSDAGLLRRLHDVIAAAKAVNEMHRDDAARAAWHAVYPFLSSEREGMAGAMCDRAEAQVLRISMLYALLDGSAVIRPEHLYAALALWRYAEESVLMLFRQATGDAVADTTLAALKSIHPGGLTREQLYKDVFQHHKKSDDIDRVIRSLSDKGHITVQHVSTGGRPKEVLLYNKSCTESTESTERVPDYVKVAKIAVESYMTAVHRKSRESAQKVQATDAPTLSVQNEQTFCANKSPENSNALPLSVLSVLSVHCQHTRIVDGACAQCGEIQDKGTNSEIRGVYSEAPRQPMAAATLCLHRNFDPEENACLDCGIALDTAAPEETY